MMRVTRIGLLCLSLLGLLSTSANAGVIFLSGDMNLGSGISGTNGNATFFSNVLGSGETVLMYDEHGNPSTDLINTYYNSLGGSITSSRNTSGVEITSSALSGVDLFFSILPTNDYTATEITALAGFLQTGGNVFFMGDNAVFTNHNNRINAALSALGSSMSLVNVTIESGSTTTTRIDSDPYTAGVTSIIYTATSYLNGGTSLVRTLSTSETHPDGYTFIAYENAVVPEPSSLALLLSLAGCGVGAVVVRRRRAKKLAV